MKDNKFKIGEKVFFLKRNTRPWELFCDYDGKNIESIIDSGHITGYRIKPNKNYYDEHLFVDDFDFYYYYKVDDKHYGIDWYGLIESDLYYSVDEIKNNKKEFIKSVIDDYNKWKEQEKEKLKKDIIELENKIKNDQPTRT
jgi:hypothetical protein